MNPQSPAVDFAFKVCVHLRVRLSLFLLRSNVKWAWKSPKFRFWPCIC